MRKLSNYSLFAIALLSCVALQSQAQERKASAAAVLPRHVLVGYWQNFTTDGTVAQTLAQVPAAYTMVEVAFANPDRTVDGGVSFEVDPQLARTIPGGYSAARFTEDIKTLHRQGRYVLLSIGGQHRSFALTSDAMAAKFAGSAYAQMQRYGFDGIDIDLENVINADNYKYLEEALRQLSAKAGPKLMITLAPQTNDMLPANPALDNYLKIAVDLGDIITMVNTQYYNSGTKRGRDGKVYTCGTVDFITSLTDAMLQQVSADKIGIGLPATAKDRGYMEPVMVNAALDCLTTGTHCGTYVPVAKYPTLRGAMFWSTNWDAASGNKFSDAVGAHLKTLDGTRERAQ
jgi:chitinase